MNCVNDLKEKILNIDNINKLDFTLNNMNATYIEDKKAIHIKSKDKISGVFKDTYYGIDFRNDDTNDISKLKELKDKRVKIILLNEKIFIETLRVDKKCNIEEKIEQLIKDRFFNYTPLVHYEVLKYNKSLFLIVYFIGCDERFKSLLYERKDFALTFPEQLPSKV